MSQRLLIVGLDRPGAIETAYYNAFRRLGINTVERFDPENKSSHLRRNRLLGRFSSYAQWELTGRSLFNHLKGKEYDAIIVFKGMLLTPSWIMRCRNLSRSAIWININPDDPFNRRSRGSTNSNILGSIRHYDIYATWAKHLLPVIREQGCADPFYLPFAYDSDEHYPPQSTNGNGEKIVFVGAWDQQREEILSQLSDLPIKIYGYGWDRIGKKSPLRSKVEARNIYGEELRETIASALASVNILRPQNHGAHNMRTFEIPAMGGLMLTTYSEEQNEFFPDGHASLMFSDVSELKSKIQQLLEGRYDVRQMKDSARALAVDHTYDDRASKLYERISDYRAGN